MPLDETTWIACLTPPGRSAIATLAIRGPDAWSLARELFQPSGKPLPERPEVGRFWLGRMGEEGRGGRDDVVLSVRRLEPTPFIEVHCHGGAEVIRMLTEAFTSRGARACSWQELELRTNADRLQSEAAINLAQAPTLRTAGILLGQLNGALDRALRAIQSALLENRIAEAQNILEKLATQIPLGRHLVEPWRVVIAGRANVGKSSLVNALAGYERSVVDPVPGTTRDVVTTMTAIDGWPVELADTAGWRSEPDALEEQGLALAGSAMRDADLCLWIIDGSMPLDLPEFQAGNVRYVINKCDLPAAWDRNSVPGAVRTSAKTGAGIAELCQAISTWLVPNPPESGTAVPFNAVLCDMVESVKSKLSSGHVHEALEDLTLLAKA